MALILASMKSVHIAEYEGVKVSIKRWEYDSENLAAPGNGAAILIPENISTIDVTFAITAGSGKIQTTTNKLEDIRTDTNVVWVDWTLGVVVATTQDSAKPVTAMRMVNVSGTTRLIMIAQ